MIALEWGDMDLIEGWLTVARSEYDGEDMAPEGKRSRTVPLTESLAVAQMLAGHAKTTTTQRYMSVSRIAIDESMRLLNRRPAWRRRSGADRYPIKLVGYGLAFHSGSHPNLQWDGSVFEEKHV